MEYTTVSETIFKELRNRILEGTYMPGETLNQTKLADELGASIIPLREALKRLQAEGFVTIVPHHRVCVTTLSQEEIDDLYLMRIELETLAARLAARKFAVTDEEKLTSLFEEIEAATRQRDYEKVYWLNKEFHFCIYQACERQHLLDILEELWTRCSRYRNLASRVPERLDAAVEERRAIVSAVEKGDMKKLLKAVRFNLEKAAKHHKSIDLARLNSMPREVAR